LNIYELMVVLLELGVKAPDGLDVQCGDVVEEGLVMGSIL
jgi:hypothetical protein